ncbi:hypothetical protein [Bordetella genomosp. 13]|uniref:hypothetical protein n=1 Tax=Bordetella genomosp. 13 TaxID=463040 RepID=UPI0011A5DE54|nr:hypothetical protein [Bordetella genomosp. 13]
MTIFILEVSSGPDPPANTTFVVLINPIIWELNLLIRDAVADNTRKKSTRQHPSHTDRLFAKAGNGREARPNTGTRLQKKKS